MLREPVDRVSPATGCLAGLHGLADESLGPLQKVVVDRLHALARQRPGVLDGLPTDPAEAAVDGRVVLVGRPAVEHAAGSVAGVEARILRPVAEVILAELTGADRKLSRDQGGLALRHVGEIGDGSDLSARVFFFATPRMPAAAGPGPSSVLGSFGRRKAVASPIPAIPAIPGMRSDARQPLMLPVHTQLRGAPQDRHRSHLPVDEPA